MKILQTIPALMLVIIFSGCGNNNAPSSGIKPDSGDKEEKKPLQRVEIYKPEALKFLDSASVIEILATGFKWTEGPLYIADGDYVLFSDIPNNKVYKWKASYDTSLYLMPSGNTGKAIRIHEPGSNGLILNKKGQLVLMQHGDRRLAVMDAPLSAPKPLYKTIAGRYQGKRLNSPNDGVMDSKGGIYFTDPPYGLDNKLDDTAKDLSFQGVYYLRPNGEVVLITDELKYPNGIALSPDEHYLYVDNSGGDNKVWMKYELDEKGLIKSKSVFYNATEKNIKDEGGPDGMKMSREGYLFSSGPGGIWIFNPQAEPIARIFIDKPVSNCAFGKDQKELYITNSDKLLRVKLK